MHLKANFSDWKNGSTAKDSFKNPTGTVSLNKVITISKKPSAELFIGSYTGIERKDKDFLPFYIGTNVLGGGFGGRLMQTVRDDQGLTYGIDASLAGYNNAGGYWVVNASFNPALFAKGYEASMVQISQWAKDGITEKELGYAKNQIIGSFKVGLATTSGLAGTLLSFVQRGFSPDYIDQYTIEMQSVSLSEVNQSIKKYVDPDKLIIIKSGSLDQNGNPMQ